MQYDSDISAYTVEKTMDMDRRLKMMRELHKTVCHNNKLALAALRFRNQSSNRKLQFLSFSIVRLTLLIKSFSVARR